MNGKLHNDRGETLVETLASILVATLSVTLLFGAVMASASIDRTARETDTAYYEALSRAEGRTDPAAGVGKVNITGAGGSNRINVELYGDGGMYSYAKGETGP